MSIGRRSPIPTLPQAGALWMTLLNPPRPRKYLAEALESLHTKRELRPQKKHGLIPL